MNRNHDVIEGAVSISLIRAAKESWGITTCEESL